MQHLATAWEAAANLAEVTMVHTLAHMQVRRLAVVDTVGTAGTVDIVVGMTVVLVQGS